MAAVFDRVWSDSRPISLDTYLDFEGFCPASSGQSSTSRVHRFSMTCSWAVGV
jgi:hypothetical protein